MIRPATEADLPRLIELGEAMHAESRFRDVAFNREKVERLLGNLMLGAGCVMVAERDGEIIGGFAGGLTAYYFSDDLMATDLALFVSSDRRGGIAAVALVRSFIEWAHERGAREVLLGTNFGNDSPANELYARIGLKQVGNLFSSGVA
jgi:GNAT superfamily N-acetyltransferase